MKEIESEADLLTNIDNIIGQFRTEYIDRYDPLPSQTTRSRLLRLYEIWQQINVRRIVDLSEAAVEKFRQQRLVAGCILSRSVLESTAIQYYAYKKILVNTKNCEPEPIHNLLLQCVFGSRDNSSHEKAIQVLTAIDHLDKEYKIFREVYDHLSEYAHPNFKGGFGSYARHEDSLETFFGVNPDRLEMRFWGLGELHMILLVAGDIHNKLCAFHPIFINMVTKYVPNIPL